MGIGRDAAPSPLTHHLSPTTVTPRHEGSLVDGRDNMRGDLAAINHALARLADVPNLANIAAIAAIVRVVIRVRALSSAAAEPFAGIAAAAAIVRVA
jgi:hypothetical protein